jgi:metabolite-proton symporter
VQPAPTTISRRSLIEAIVASTIGTTIEWYDFFLYGTATALVFQPLFFPTKDPFTGQLLAFSTFTAGFLARPLGGVVFGYMGDRVGRKAALVTTLLLMGISTVAVGFLPTYDQIGLAAPLLLTALRLLQGLGVGGEWGGAVLLALEYGHRGRRGFFASWPQLGVPLGLLASNVALTVCVDWLSPEDFLSWGWRVPFYLSGLLIVLGLLIRLRILETPLFQAIQQEDRVAEAPVREVLRRHWREVLLVAGTRIAENACFYLFALYVITYGKDVLKVDSAVMLGAINVAACVECFTIPLFGVLSDRFSRRGAYVAGCCFLIAFAVPFFALLDTREPAMITLAIVLGLAGGHAVLYSVQGSLIPELFGTRLRCTGASIGYQLAVPLAGGLAPIIASLLVREFPDQYWPLAGYIILISVISLACVQRLAETSRKDIGAAE